MPKDLYRELGFSAGAVNDEFSEYQEDITTSDLGFSDDSDKRRRIYHGQFFG